jgi:hypothetical protein
MYKAKQFYRKLGLPLTRIILLISVFFGLASAIKHSLFIYAKTINAGVLRIEYPDSGALFSASNIAPGYEETKTIKVTNTGVLPHSFSIAVTGALGPLAEVLEIEPKINNVSIWKKTVTNIAKFPQSDVIISSIAPGSSINIDFTARLPLTVGNEYQGKTTSAFDFIVGNESTDQPEPSPTPITPATPIIPAFLGPGLAAPGITPSVTTPSAVALKPQEKGVSEEKQVKGVLKRVLCWWWLILSLIFAIFLIVYGYFVYKRKIKEDKNLLLSWLWPFIGAAVFYIIHLFAHRYFEPSRWCSYFLWIEIAELIIYFGTIYYFKKRQENKKESI